MTKTARPPAAGVFSASRLPWLLLVAAAGVLSALFFTYPLARGIFGPLAVATALLALVRPLWALGWVVAAALPALAIPLILELPYFSGAEPLLWAFLLGVGLRRLVKRDEQEGLGSQSLAAGCALWFILGVAGSCALALVSLADLPDGWGSRILWDASGKIFFWRWGDPLHVLRMSLLLVTGPVVFWVAGSVLREAGRRSFLVVFAALGLAALGLAGVSTFDLFWRGKSLSLWPGFGPIFTDKNAYAGFWVCVSPLLWVPAVRLRGWGRAAARIGLAVTAFWCAVSLSITGWLVWPAAGLLSLTLLWRRGEWAPSRRLVVSGAACLVALCLAAAAGAWALGPRIHLAERLGERISFWLPAWEAFQDRPLLGHGPGEFYRLLPEYRRRLQDLPESHFTQENVHNYFLQLAAETGVVGLAAFLAWTAAVVVPVMRWRTLPVTSWEGNGAPESLRRQTSGLAVGGRLRSWLAAAQGLGEAAWGDGRTAAGAAMLALLAFSVAQHPLLRLEFQVWFGVLAAVVALPRPAQAAANSEPRGRRLVVPSLLAAVVFLAALVQARFWGLTDRSSFHYGWHKPPSGSSRRPGPGEFTAEGLAFWRVPAEQAPSRLSLRCLPGEDRADVSVYLDRAWYLVTVTSEPVSWEVPKSAAEPVEIGLRRWTPAARPFADSWGAGVVVNFEP
ncbi:MAG: hypothetical protein Kow00109_22040 [Acidobacteriota bacterium]